MKKKTIAIMMTAAMVMARQQDVAAGVLSFRRRQQGSKLQDWYSAVCEHGSLDNCREGFLEGLEEEGIKEGDNLKVEVKNAMADTATNAQIADSFVSDNMDLICAIATPSAQSAYNAAMDKDIPVVYTAVTDPVAAELADKDGNPVGNVTGTSDTLPVEEQLKMIREMMPDAKTIGILYTTSEANSVSAIATYESLVDKYGFTLETKGISQTSEIALATDDLLTKELTALPILQITP